MRATSPDGHSRWRRGRAVAGAALASCVALGVLTPGALLPAAATATPKAPAPRNAAPLEPLPADAFVDSVGVVTHFRYTDRTYAKSDELLDAVQALGVRHVRDGFPAQDLPEVMDVFKSFPEHDLGLNLVVGSAGAEGSLAPAADVLAAVDDAGIADVVESIEAPNEWDLKGGDDWREDLDVFQRELYEAVRADPRWDGVPVVGPSVGRKMRIPQLAGLGPFMDVANLHNYAAGDPPEVDLNQIDRAQRIAPGKPLFITETGYHTALQQTDRQKPVSEQVKAEYILRTLLENFAAGVDRTYLYQLVDEQPEPTRTDQEAHFGLLRADLSRTPAYERLAEVLGALSDPGPQAERAGDGYGREVPRQRLTPVRLSVADDDAGVEHLLLQKRDGSYFLALWKRGSLFTDGKTVDTATTPVTVNFGSRGRTVSLVNNGVGELGTARTLDVRLGRSVAVLELGASAQQTSTFSLSVEVPEAGDTQQAAQPGSRLTTVLVAVLVLLLLAAAAGLLWLRRRRAGRGRGGDGRGGGAGGSGPGRDPDRTGTDHDADGQDGGPAPPAGDVKVVPGEVLRSDASRP